MKVALLILSIISLGSVAAFGQPSIVIGAIDKIARNEITVKTPRGSFTIYAGDRTEVVNGKIYRDLSPLKVGHEISARCEPNSSGKLFAVKMWANVVTFSATVKYVKGDDIEVVTSPNSDYRREELRIVHFYPDTAFSTTRKDVTVGQSVRVVGLDVENGAVDAARIAVYNTDLPVTK